MKQGKRSAIVNTASLAGLVNAADLGGGSPYIAAKFGVTLISEALANDLRRAKANVSAHVLCPMATATNFGNSALKTDGAGKDIGGGLQKMVTRVGQDPQELAEHLVISCLCG